MSEIVKEALAAKLREVRSALLAALDGLGDYDLRRPLVPSGTNLLGLVKHLTGNEHVYLAETFGEPAADVLPWVADGSVWDGADLWARPEESSADLLTLYRRACAASDALVERLDLDAPGRVPHWPADRARTTLGFVLVRMVAETAQHAGHAEIVRELIDSRTGADAEDPSRQAGYLARVQESAEAYAPTT